MDLEGKCRGPLEVRNLHEGTKDIKVFSLRIAGVPVQFQTYICRTKQSYRYANLFGWNSSF